MTHPDEYEYFKTEHQENKTQPYTMHNEQLADEYYAALKEEYPAASIHKYGIAQYICMDNRARRNLVKTLKAQQKKQAEALQNTIDLINEVESEGV